MLIVSAVSQTSALKSLEESKVAKVSLQITQSVRTDSQHLGHRQPTLREMLREITESMVLITACTHHTHYGLGRRTSQAIILAIATCSGKRSTRQRILVRI